MVETLAVGVSLSYYERSQNDGAEGSQARQWAIWVMARGCRVEPSTIDEGCPACRRAPPLDLDECGGRALVRRRLENGLRLVGRQRYAMDAAPCAAFRAVAREGARRPSTSFLSRR